MFKKIGLLLLVFIIATDLVSCREVFLSSKTDLPAAPMEKGIPDMADYGGDITESALGQTQEQTKNSDDLKVIYTAELTLEVKKYDEAVVDIVDIVKAEGGFIANSDVNVGANGTKSGTIVVKVPSGKFHEILNTVKGIGKVRYVAEHGQDVTEKYTDLETRLQNAKKMEMRILELMQKNTKSVKDLLEVEKELGRVRAEIEQLEGRKRFLDNKLSLSMIMVSLSEPYVYTSSIMDPIKRAWDSAGDAFMSSLGVLITFFAHIIPWLIPGGLVLWFVVRLIRPRGKKRSKES